MKKKKKKPGEKSNSIVLGEWEPIQLKNIELFSCDYLPLFCKKGECNANKQTHIPPKLQLVTIPFFSQKSHSAGFFLYCLWFMSELYMSKSQFGD